MNSDGSMTVTVESVLEPTGETVRKEFTIEKITDVRDRFVLIDEDGEGRLMLSGDELRDLSIPDSKGDR